MRSKTPITLALAATLLAFAASDVSAQPIPFPTGLPPIPTGLPIPIPGPAPTGGKTAKINSIKSEGDLRLSGGIGMEASGSLGFTIAAIRHPDAGVSVSPLLVAFSVSASGAAAAGLTCTVSGASATQRANVDLVFVNDTTGSMSQTVMGISDSVKKFAEEIASGGIDARFSMYTFGDAWATRGKPGKFWAGQGDYDPPTFDPDARPYVGLTSLNMFEKFLGEMKSSGVLGVGGGDDPENLLGTLLYANSHLAFRAGASRQYIAITDNASHQKGDGSKFGPWWLPPSAEETLSAIRGSAVVHVVGRDIEKAPYYNPKRLADETGGDFKVLPKDGRVDLGALNMKQWLVNSFRGSCVGSVAGYIKVSVKATVVGKKIYTGTLTFDISVG